MPIYEFVCTDCGNEVEVLQKINDPHLKDCSSCGKSTMKKKVSAAAFRLSGSGWYETDFKSGDKKNLKDAEKPKPKEAKEKAKAKPDSKSTSDKSSDTSKKPKSD